MFWFFDVSWLRQSGHLGVHSRRWGSDGGTHVGPRVTQSSANQESGVVVSGASVDPCTDDRDVMSALSCSAQIRCMFVTPPPHRIWV